MNSLLPPKPKENFDKMKSFAIERINENWYKAEKDHFFNLLEDVLDRKDFYERLTQHHLNDIMLINASSQEQYINDINQLWNEFKGEDYN